jgi:predicted lipoprotein
MLFRISRNLAAFCSANSELDAVKTANESSRYLWYVVEGIELPMKTAIP